MTELDYFQYFKEHQLHSVDFDLGIINVRVPAHNQYSKNRESVVYNVGSKNEDGYFRVWCGAKRHPEIGSKLKMKYRLIYFLFHGDIPEGAEIDHIDRNRSNDSIHNLRAVTRKQNCSNTKNTSVRGTYSVEQITKVCLLLQDTEHSDLTIAKMTGLSRNYVRDIKKRRRKTKVSTNFSWLHRE